LKSSESVNNIDYFRELEPVAGEEFPELGECSRSRLPKRQDLPLLPPTLRQVRAISYLAPIFEKVPVIFFKIGVTSHTYIYRKNP
jgi:hypothetical protein